MWSVDLNVHKSRFGLDGDLVDSEAMLNDVSNIEDFVSYFTSIETLHMNLCALFTTECSVEFSHYKRRQGQP